MKIGMIGTGMVGQTLAGKLDSLGHEVVIGTRDPAATLARTSPDMMGNPPFKVWHEAHTRVKLATFAEAARHGEIVIGALTGSAALDALRAAGEENLAGKVLVDISNPLDFSKGMPPTLFVSNTDSLGELVQRAFPKARVVKTLNTVNAAVMIEPGLVDGGDHSVFMSSNDPEAKAVVRRMLTEWFGWRDVIDLGDISSARATEMLMPIWLRLWGALGTPMIGFKVVR
jgi:8-hydroxy-5-deazaflavin:NADPH oxidoreductase